MWKIFSGLFSNPPVYPVGDYYRHIHHNDVIKITQQLSDKTIEYQYLELNNKPMFESPKFTAELKNFSKSKDWVKLLTYIEPVLVVPNETDKYTDKDWGDTIIQITKISPDKTKIRYKFIQINNVPIPTSNEYEMKLTTLNSNYNIK